MLLPAWSALAEESGAGSGRQQWLRAGQPLLLPDLTGIALLGPFDQLTWPNLMEALQIFFSLSFILSSIHPYLPLMAG